MNKTRIIGLVAGAILIVGAILIGLGFNLAPPAEGAGSPNSGKGEISLNKDKPALSDRASGPAFTGYGDLRTRDQRSGLANGAAPASGPALTGFLSLRTRDQRFGQVDSSAPASSAALNGFGGLRTRDQRSRR